MKKKIINKEDQSKIDLAAEQWVRLVMEHIRWKKRSKKEKEVLLKQDYDNAGLKL